MNFLNPHKWLAGMRRLASGTPSQPAPRRLLFVIQGRQSTHPGMGRGLYDAEPAFREMAQRCCRTIEERNGIHLQTAFERDEEAALVHRNEFHAILINAVVQVSLLALWQSKGIVPEAAVGLSLGEITSPFAAGALNPEEIMAVARAAAQWDERLLARGKLVTIRADLATVQTISLRCPVEFELFAEMGPTSVIVFCLLPAVPAIVEFLSGQGLEHKVGIGDYAYHTPRFAACKDIMAEELAFLAPQPLQCDFYSSLSGGLIPSGAFFDASYWYWMLAKPVLFNTALEAALIDGYDTILNIAPHPVLKPHLQEAAAKLGKDVLILDSLRDDEPETVTFNRTYKALIDRGVVKAEGGNLPPGRTEGHRVNHKSNSLRSSVSTVVKTPFLASQQRITVDLSDFDISAPEVIQNPYPFYKALRERGPVHWLEKNGFWLVVDYAETAAALKQPQIYSSQPAQGLDPVLIGADPPAHTRVRQTLAPFFTPSAMAELEDFVSAKAAQLWQEAAQKGAFDIVKEFAEPLSDYTAAHLLGLDGEATNHLRQLSSANRYQIAEHYQAVGAFFAEYQVSGEGLARILSDQFSPPEAASLLKALWLAGTTTTGMLIAAATHWLLRLPSLRYEIIDEMALLPQYLEEVLRFDAPEQTAWRVTTQETELGGVAIPANAQVRLCLAAANRDPRHFTNPDSLVLSRKVNDHLAFGLGPHYCLGAALSRLEARVALSVWLRAAPKLRAMQPFNAMRYVQSGHFRALESLTVKTE